MNYKYKILSVAAAGMLVLSSAPTFANEQTDISNDLKALEAQVLELENKLVAQAAQPALKKQAIKVGGAFRVNYSLKDWDEASKDKSGDFDFDVFRINVDGEIKNIILSAEYRWYEYMNVIHHGWLGYDFTDSLQGQLGVTQVPFGLLPYASHNWWFGLPYYLGLEDDYDMGGKMIYSSGPLNVQAAFFKNDEWGNAANSERYSFDSINSGTQQNEETNQVNLRGAYTLKYGDDSSTEIGASLEWGELYNTTTTDSGDHWAAAVHVNGNYGKFNTMLEYIRYQYDPANPVGVSEDSVLMGAFGGTYEVASKGELYVAGISYDVPVSWGAISKLTFYDDYSYINKDKDGWNSSQINTLGCMVTAGALYTYIDLISGKNAPWLGSGSRALTSGDDQEWQTRFNVNFGFYF